MSILRSSHSGEGLITSPCIFLKRLLLAVWVMSSSPFALLGSLNWYDYSSLFGSDAISGQSLGVCYSAFRKGQHPGFGPYASNATSRQVMEDLEILSQNGTFEVIRLFGCDENTQTVLQLIRQAKIPIKVMLGAWIGAEIDLDDPPPGKSMESPEELELNKTINRQELQRLVKLANQYEDIVVAVVVGNNTVSGPHHHKLRDAQLLAYFLEVKNLISQPITVAESHDWWLESDSKVIEQVDFIAVNFSCVWHQMEVDMASVYIVEKLHAVHKKFPTLCAVISEIGWPTESSNYKDHTGESYQNTLFSNLLPQTRYLGILTFLFEAFDADWKKDPIDGFVAEKHMGVFTAGRKAKLSMKERYPARYHLGLKDHMVGRW